jgi:hypothetical protein
VLGPGSFATDKALPLLHFLGCCLKLLILSKNGRRHRLGRCHHCAGFRPRPKQSFSSVWIHPEGYRRRSYRCQQYLCQFVRAETSQNFLHQGRDDFCSAAPVAGKLIFFFNPKKTKK